MSSLRSWSGIPWTFGRDAKKPATICSCTACMCFVALRECHIGIATLPKVQISLSLAAAHRLTSTCGLPQIQYLFGLPIYCLHIARTSKAINSDSGSPTFGRNQEGVPCNLTVEASTAACDSLMELREIALRHTYL